MSLIRARKRYADQQKKKALGMLKQLAQRIERGELIVESHGFWTSNVDNHVMFRVITVARDVDKELEDFHQYQ